MKKFIYLSFLTLIFSILIRCGGMPDESPDSQIFSFIFNGNFQKVVYEKVGQQGNDITGEWIAKDENRGFYSIIQFDENNNFAETVHSKLNREVMASYEGEYNVNKDDLEIESKNGSMFLFAFSINTNQLHLSAK